MPTRDLCSLDVAECLRLLRSVSIGRLVYTDYALPAVRPVGFTVPDGHVVVRCGRGEWARRLEGGMVGFEADLVDPGSRDGWSVMVLGHAHMLDPGRLTTLPDLTSPPWPAGAEDLFLAVDIEHITGRLLGPAEGRDSSPSQALDAGGGQTR